MGAVPGTQRELWLWKRGHLNDADVLIKETGFAGRYGRGRRRAWQSTPVFLPGESNGQRSLVDYSPWGLRESDTTEVNWHAYMVEVT